jgi:hypothetical protein
MKEVVEYNKYRFTNVDEFLKSISYGGELFNLFAYGFFFRGHSKQEYKLIPSSLRKEPFFKFLSFDNLSEDESILRDKEFIQIYQEYELLLQFYEGCDETSLKMPFIDDINFEYHIDKKAIFPHFSEWIPQSMYGLAALAQHHRVPTRLLDWTRDITTAIYFALSDYLNGMVPDYSNHFEIWALDAKLVEDLGKDFPLRIIKPPYSENPNLSAQKGVFTLWKVSYDTLFPKELQKDDKSIVVENDIEIDRRPLDEILISYFKNNPNLCKGTYLYRIVFPIDIPRLYKYITKMKANAKYLFPGYDGVRREMKERAVVEKIYRVTGKV